MPLMPFTILGIWLRGLLALAIPAVGLALLWRGYDHSRGVELVETRAAERAGDGKAPAVRVVPRERWAPGWNRPTAEMAAGLALLAWALVGRALIGAALARVTGGSSAAGAGAVSDSGAPPPVEGGELREVLRPDGTRLWVECFGPSDAPPVVLTHGWGADRRAWGYAVRDLAERFRVVVWDLRGLGKSGKAGNNDYSLETMAADLDAVLRAAVDDRPAVVVGHSIGGMIALTFCRLFPEALGARVAGLVLVHTTYTDPVRTTRGASVYTALETPVLVPLMYLTIALWPLVWLMNWMSYLNGSVHRSAHRQSFAGTETRGQLDLVARMLPEARPDVLARGMLAMTRYDATGVLGRINVPVTVVAGDRDTTTPPEAAREMAKTIPRADLVTLAPARHVGLMERHEEFDRTAAGFAADCLRAGVTG
jgi:pimeloyl-ACP methyl ester carboxylesterase